MFGFLGTIGDDIQSAAQGVADAVGNLVDDARHDPHLGGVIDNTVNKVRQDLANGVAQLGAGATNAATSTIAGRTSVVTLPFTTGTLAVFGVALVLVILLVFLLWRRR